MTTTRSAFEHARSFLFVPGDRPDRFASAEASGADVVVFDLEDAVASEAKSAARVFIAEHLSRRDRSTASVATAVRISAPATEAGKADLDVLESLSDQVAIVVAKADADSLAAVCARLRNGAPVLPLVESARGVLEVGELAAGSATVRLLFGHLDLCAELGIDPSDAERLRSIRLALRIAAAASDLAPPADGVTADFRDDDVLRADMSETLRSGFSGKLCIHPAQLDIVHDALMPRPDELAWAQKIVELASADGVAVIDGAMVDRPVRLRAQAIIDRNGRNNDGPF